ncbi:MAG: AgmX/PglI C-terminal domain-containing protein [Sandaracinus sp.]
MTSSRALRWALALSLAWASIAGAQSGDEEPTLVTGDARPPRATTGPAGDRDGDRIPDASDLCPDVAEREARAFPGDGCPDTDGDRDGVVDDYDACPSAPETVNGSRDLDGCPDAPSDPPATLRARAGCFVGAAMLDVRAPSGGTTQLVPRSDAPTWLGAGPLDCYASVAFDGRRALHCASATVEATLVMAGEGEHAIGMAVVRVGTRLERRAWSGTRLPDLDPSAVRAVVDQHGDETSACYESDASARGREGRVVVTLTIGADGTTRAEVTRTTFAPAAPALEQCLVRVLSGLSVPAPACAPSTQVVAFSFEPEP